MSNKTRNPISHAARQEDTDEALSNYRHSQEKSKVEYATMVKVFYELITDFYEFGWGESFHFAPSKDSQSFEEAITNHQYFLGNAMNLRPGLNVLDVGCGVGGPQRSIARKFGATITGLNISEYQLKKCAEYNAEADLDELCRVLLGDFMAIPAEDQSFDAAYHFEAIAHAPDKKRVYAEIFRVLKPSAIFAGYDWCTTPSFDAENPVHRDLKERIEFGNALPQIASFSDVDEGLRSAGFELIETGDRALDSDPATPWYHPLGTSGRSLRSFARSTLGRKVTSLTLRVLELLRVVPRGATQTQGVLNIAADSLLAAGRLGIFTPMYYHKARKPA
ncbi:MAG: methyltransferase domain-containing protein [Pseudomonadales bacterium]|nr:methyltransferase domain-containing protein [Pseudomonadales bacterium]